VVTQVSDWMEKIATVIRKLTGSLEKLRPLMSKLEEIWASIKKGLSGLRKAEDGADTATRNASHTTDDGTHAPHTDGDSTAPSNAGDTTTPSSHSVDSTPGHSGDGDTTAPSSGRHSSIVDRLSGNDKPTTTSGREPRGGWTGAGHVEGSSPAAEAAYRRIRETPDDVPKIAENTGLDESVVARAKKNLFLEQHDVQLGPNQVKNGYFTADEDIASLWTKASQGTLDPAERNTFRGLVAHEYVENRLMEAGMPYKSAHPDAWNPDGSARFNPQHFGAHEVAPNAWNNASLNHWRALGLTPPDTPLADDLANLDDVVNAARQGLDL
jgi:hypothetical protein